MRSTHFKAVVFYTVMVRVTPAEEPLNIVKYLKYQGLVDCWIENVGKRIFNAFLAEFLVF
jgi:hypothetical protein